MVSMQAMKVFPTEITGHCVERQDYQHIMYQRQNGTCCKTDILETEPDVDQHADGGNDHCHDRI